MTEIPEGFDVDTDPYTDEDGFGDDGVTPVDVDRPLSNELSRAWAGADS